MHFRNSRSERIGFAYFRLFNFIPRDELHPSGISKFIPRAYGPWDEFLPSGYNSSLGMKFSLQHAKPNSFFPRVTKFPNCFHSFSREKKIVKV